MAVIQLSQYSEHSCVRQVHVDFTADVFQFFQTISHQFTSVQHSEQSSLSFFVEEPVKEKNQDILSILVK